MKSAILQENSFIIYKFFTFCPSRSGIGQFFLLLYEKL